MSLPSVSPTEPTPLMRLPPITGLDLEPGHRGLDPKCLDDKGLDHKSWQDGRAHPLSHRRAGV